MQRRRRRRGEGALNCHSAKQIALFVLSPLLKAVQKRKSAARKDPGDRDDNVAAIRRVGISLSESQFPFLFFDSTSFTVMQLLPVILQVDCIYIRPLEGISSDKWR